MVKIEKIGKGTYFENAYKVSFRYDVSILGKVKSLAERRYLPEERAWEIPAHELPKLTELLEGKIETDGKIMEVLKEKEIEDKRQATAQRLRDIKPAIPFSFKTAPLPHQIEAFNMGLEKDSLLIGDQQGLGKTKESIDITVARKKEICKCLVVCGVNSVKYNWEKEIRIHSGERSTIIDDKTMDKRVQHINAWYKGAEYFGIINIESLRNEKIQDALYVGIKDGFIGAVIVDEIHKAKNGQSQQGKALRTLRAPIKIGLTGTPIMSKAEDLWNILTWLGAERRNVYQFRNAYCVMGGYGDYKVVSYKNLDDLNALLNTVMLRRTKAEVLDLPPKVYHAEYVELTKKQQTMYRDIRQGIIENLEDILTSVNPLTCTLRLRQLTGGLFTEDNPKLERVMDMLDEEIVPNGEKAIIFSQWESVAEVYKEALAKYNPAYIIGKVSPADRQKEVDRFQNDSSCKVAIGTIGAMGTGLTLNKAGYVFFIDKMWTSGDNEQAEDRAHRIGTTGTVNIISMLAKGSIDEEIEDYLRDNKDLFDRVVDGKGTRADIRSLLNKLLRI